MALARRSGRSAAMLRHVLTNPRPGPTVVVCATGIERDRILRNTVVLCAEYGLEPQMVCDDTLAIAGRRVYFQVLELADRDRARGMWPGPRYIDHHAADVLMRRWLASLGSGEPVWPNPEPEVWS